MARRTVMQKPRVVRALVEQDDYQTLIGRLDQAGIPFSAWLRLAIAKQNYEDARCARGSQDFLPHGVS